MSGSAAGHDGDLRQAIFAVYDFVGDVAAHRGVGVRDAEESGVDEMCRIVDEVFRCVVY